MTPTSRWHLGLTALLGLVAGGLLTSALPAWTAAGSSRPVEVELVQHLLYAPAAANQERQLRYLITTTHDQTVKTWAMAELDLVSSTPEIAPDREPAIDEALATPSIASSTTALISNISTEAELGFSQLDWHDGVSAASETPSTSTSPHISSYGLASTPPTTPSTYATSARTPIVSPRAPTPVAPHGTMDPAPVHLTPRTANPKPGAAPPPSPTPSTDAPETATLPTPSEPGASPETSTVPASSEAVITTPETATVPASSEPVAAPETAAASALSEPVNTPPLDDNDAVLDAIIEPSPEEPAHAPEGATELLDADVRAISGDEDEMEKRLEWLAGQLNQCFDAALTRHPKLSGTQVITFSVLKGRVGKVVLGPVHLGDAQAEHCLQSMAQRAKYDKSWVGKVRVTYRFYQR